MSFFCKEIASEDFLISSHFFGRFLGDLFYSFQRAYFSKHFQNFQGFVKSFLGC